MVYFNFFAISGVTSSVVQTQSQVPSGLGYYMAVANNYANRINKVIAGPDPNQPNLNPSEEEQIAQQSIVTRSVSLIVLLKCHSFFHDTKCANYKTWEHCQCAIFTLF